MNETFLRLSIGVMVAALLVLAGSLYISTRYLEEWQRLSGTGDTESAMQSAETAARLDPFSAEPLAAEADLLRGEGRDREAEPILQAAAEREPADYGIQQEIGDIRLDSMNRPLEAAESYQRAYELNPEDEESLAGLSEAYLSAGELEKAKTSYERLRESGEITVDQLYTLGRIYVRTGEPEEGLQALREDKGRVESGMQGLTGELRQRQMEFLVSVELAIADALVVERRYAEARQIVANSSSEQTPTILSLIDATPEEYRQMVIDSDVY